MSLRVIFHIKELFVNFLQIMSTEIKAEEEELMEQASVSSTDSEDDDQEEQKRNEKIQELQSILAENSYLYQSHVDLIEALSEAGEFEQLRLAREKFASFYPLTSKIWLSWIGDEQRMASTEAEKMKIVELFDRAVKDYLSVELWMEYCQVN